jgi:hypothetical protein
MAPIDDFEIMLRQQEDLALTNAAKAEYQNQQSGIQRADKGATLFDFIKMVNKLVNLTMKDLKVEFIPEEGKTNVIVSDKPLDHPYIIYKVLYRKPKKELKPRQREEVREILHDTESERYGEVYGQKFECIVQFNIFASVYEQAHEVMEKFEDMIFMYTGFFKKNGIAEILFHQQVTDETYDTFRQNISVRNLQYYVEVEKLTVIFKEKIKEIEALLSLESQS